MCVCLDARLFPDASCLTRCPACHAVLDQAGAGDDADAEVWAPGTADAFQGLPQASGAASGKNRDSRYENSTAPTAARPTSGSGSGSSTAAGVGASSSTSRLPSTAASDAGASASASASAHGGANKRTRSQTGAAVVTSGIDAPDPLLKALARDACPPLPPPGHNTVIVAAAAAATATAAADTTAAASTTAAATSSVPPRRSSPRVRGGPHQLAGVHLRTCASLACRGCATLVSPSSSAASPSASTSPAVAVAAATCAPSLDCSAVCDPLSSPAGAVDVAVACSDTAAAVPEVVPPDGLPMPFPGHERQFVVPPCGVFPTQDPTVCAAVEYQLAGLSAGTAAKSSGKPIRPVVRSDDRADVAVGCASGELAGVGFGGGVAVAVSDALPLSAAKVNFSEPVCVATSSGTPAAAVAACAVASAAGASTAAATTAAATATENAASSGQLGGVDGAFARARKAARALLSPEPTYRRFGGSDSDDSLPAVGAFTAEQRQAFSWQLAHAVTWDRSSTKASFHKWAATSTPLLFNVPDVDASGHEGPSPSTSGK